jgi:NADH dehydrogenase FAD-containing subunit
VLVVNVGSKTRGMKNVPGVYEHAITTRPINDLIGKVIKREQELLATGEQPVVVVCGAGAAGTELSFAFKQRWSKLFQKDIKLSLVSSSNSVLPGVN